MKRLINIDWARRLMLCLLCCAPLAFTACSDDDDKDKGDPYFELENSPTSYEPTSAQINYTLTVRSNRAWRIVSKTEGEDWVRPFPDEGDEDGRFMLMVSENKTFEKRAAQFAIVVENEEYPILLNVEQAAAVPTITIGDGSGTVTTGSSASQLSLTYKANVEWEAKVDAAASSWLKLDSITAAGLMYVSVAENTDVERTGVIHCVSAEQPSANVDLKVVQSDGGVMIHESFDWLGYGQQDGKIDPPYTTDRQVRIDSWTPEERAHGWTTTAVNTGSKEEPLVYACYGYVKLGKTSWAGDLISPKLSRLQQPTNVVVTFKAMGYISAGGTQDDNDLFVSVIGPGTVQGAENPYKITNYPNSTKMEHGENYDPWAPEIAQRSFTVVGATAETQIKFMAGAAYSLKGVGKGKNRIFLDDITVRTAK